MPRRFLKTFRDALRFLNGNVFARFFSQISKHSIISRFLAIENEEQAFKMQLNNKFLLFI